MGIPLWAVLAVLAAAQAPTPEVGQIMARVAVNQQSARDARQRYVYRQQELLRMHRGNDKLAREERRDYSVTPAPRGFDKSLTAFAGSYERNGKYVAYGEPGYKYRGMDIDGDLMRDMADDMMNDRESADGIARDLFPLTAEEQRKYDFRLVDTEPDRGRPVYRVAFAPRRGAHDGDGASWKGEALIDAAECQPVLVTTSLDEKVPLLVKTLLGTDIKGLGFSIAYRRLDGGVWFPVSYGGEFEVRGLFFYRRKISVSMENSDFRQTQVRSTVAYGADAH